MARLEKWHGNKAEWVLRAWTDTWLSEEFADWSLEPELRNVHCPVLAIHGEDDEYGSVAFPKFIAGNVSGKSGVSIFSGCGHFPHRERADDVIEEVRRFLANPDPEAVNGTAESG